MADKIRKQQEAVLRAQERLGTSLAKERDSQRKRRDGRLLKLGVLAEQMFLAGDLSLLSRFESAALEQFKDRKVDRLDFELDEADNWFDRTRKESQRSKEQRAAAGGSTKSSGPSAASEGSSSPKSASSAPLPRPGAVGGTSGASATSPPSSAASA